MKKLILTNSDKVALVDDEDWEWVSEYNWQLGGRNEVIRCTSWHGVKYNVLLHRVINDTPIGMCTDHKNRNPLDNRKENLRTCTHSQNNTNRLKFKNSKTSQYRGVHFDKTRPKDPWVAQINRDGRRVKLGNFINERDAAIAYNNAAQKQYGDFPILNQL